MSLQKSIRADKILELSRTANDAPTKTAIVCDSVDGTWGWQKAHEALDYYSEIPTSDKIVLGKDEVYSNKVLPYDATSEGFLTFIKSDTSFSLSFNVTFNLADTEGFYLTFINELDKNGIPFLIEISRQGVDDQGYNILFTVNNTTTNTFTNSYVNNTPIDIGISYDYSNTSLSYTVNNTSQTVTLDTGGKLFHEVQFGIGNYQVNSIVGLNSNQPDIEIQKVQDVNNITDMELVSYRFLKDNTVSNEELKNLSTSTFSYGGRVETVGTFLESNSRSRRLTVTNESYRHYQTSASDGYLVISYTIANQATDPNTYAFQIKIYDLDNVLTNYVVSLEKNRGVLNSGIPVQKGARISIEYIGIFNGIPTIDNNTGVASGSLVNNPTEIPSNTLITVSVVSDLPSLLITGVTNTADDSIVQQSRMVELEEYMYYDENTERLVAIVPVQTTLNSFYIGDQHIMSSGAENIFFSNQSSDVDYFPSWGSISETNWDKMSARTYSDLIVSDNGVDLGNNKLARSLLQLQVNTSIFKFQTTLKQTLTIGDKISIDVYYYNENGDVINDVIDSPTYDGYRGIKIYNQSLVLTQTYAVDDLFTMEFNHPLEAHAGTKVAIDICRVEPVTNTFIEFITAAGSTVANNSNRFHSIQYVRIFEDKEVALREDINLITFDATDTSTLNFKLDDTHTTVLISSGQSFGVNSIKAINANGIIQIMSFNEQNTPVITNIEESKVRIYDEIPSGTINDVINVLNELFSVGAYEQVVTNNPYPTSTVDVTGINDAFNFINGATDVGDGTVTGAGGGNYSPSTTLYNEDGVLSGAFINKQDEYFSFEIKGQGTIGLGFVNTVNSFNGGFYAGIADYADPSNFCTGSGNANSGYQFSLWLNTSSEGPWSVYGTNPNYVKGKGWSNLIDGFKNSAEGTLWNSGSAVRMRCGINFNRYLTVDYYDVSADEWVMCTRSSYPVPEQAEFRLGIKFGDIFTRLNTVPLYHLQPGTATNMFFRWIESPDGTFQYPLFNTQEEVDYYNTVKGNLLTDFLTIIFTDEPTGNTWYYPTNEYINNGVEDPTGTNFDNQLFDGNKISWTEITTLPDSLFVPTTFSGPNLEHDEGYTMNLELKPVSASYTQTVDITPAGSGLSYDVTPRFLTGTLNEVTVATLYTVTVTRTNMFGSSVGSFTINVTNVSPAVNTDWFKAVEFDGNFDNAIASVSSPLAMGGIGGGNLVDGGGNPISVSGHSTDPLTKTSDDPNARPWAFAVTFYVDTISGDSFIAGTYEFNNSTQDDLIGIRIINNDLVFTWGRDVDGYNTCLLKSNVTTGWYSFYVESLGRREVFANSVTANALAAAIRIFEYDLNNLVLSSDLSIAANWINTNVKMNRLFLTPAFGVGGRGQNESFNGKIAMLSTRTLRTNVAAPTSAEIIEFMTDPGLWLNNQNGQPYRKVNDFGDTASWGFLNADAAAAYQVFFMGDLNLDAYPLIRNISFSTNTGYSLVMINMVAGDIVDVIIPNLTSTP